MALAYTCCADLSQATLAVFLVYAAVAIFVAAIRPPGGPLGAICFAVLALFAQRYVASGFVTKTVGKLAWHYDATRTGVGASVRGRLVVVTGASSGIGFWTAAELARLGAKVVVTARTAARAEATRAQVAAAAGVPESAIVGALALELGDRASIRAFADALGAVADRVNGGAVDVVVHNAGAAGHPGGRRVTADGVELMLACNYLGPFLLTELLAPRLKRTAGSRIVYLSSRAIEYAKDVETAVEVLHTDFTQGEDIVTLADVMRVYGTSKWGVTALARDVAKRHGIETCSVHPGLVSTPFMKFNDSINAFFGDHSRLGCIVSKTAYEGAIAVLHCVLEPRIAPGAYYRDSVEASHALHPLAHACNDEIILEWARVALADELENATSPVGADRAVA